MPTEPSSPVRTFARLLRGHPLFVQADPGIDPRRFRSVFGRVWRQIPLADRRALLLLWRDWTGAAFYRRLGEQSVIAMLAATRDDRHRTGYASCAPHTGALWFFDPLVRIMPEPVLAVLIAHEVAHALMWARGKGEDFHEQTHSDYRRSAHVYWNDPEERHVRRLAGAWGFPEATFRAWERRNKKRIFAAG